MANLKTFKQAISRVFIVLILISLCCILFLTGRFAYNELFLKSSRIDLFQKQISAEINKISKIIESAEKIPQDLAYILEFQNVDETEIKILLESVLFNTPELVGTAIAYEPYQFYPDSMYYAPYLYRNNDVNTFTYLNSPEYNYFYKDWYLVPKTLLRSTWSEPYFDQGGGNLLMSTYSVPFYKYDGLNEKFNGIVTVDVSVEWLTKAIEAFGKEWNGESLLISENGTIVSAPDHRWIFNETIFSLSSEMNLPVLREIGRDLQNGESGIQYIDQFQNTKDWIVFYSHIKINKWGFIFLMKQENLSDKKINLNEKEN